MSLASARADTSGAMLADSRPAQKENHEDRDTIPVADATLQRLIHDRQDARALDYDDRTMAVVEPTCRRIVASRRYLRNRWPSSPGGAPGGHRSAINPRAHLATRAHWLRGSTVERRVRGGPLRDELAR